MFQTKFLKDFVCYFYKFSHLVHFTFIICAASTFIFPHVRSCDSRIQIVVNEAGHAER